MNEKNKLIDLNEGYVPTKNQNKVLTTDVIKGYQPTVNNSTNSSKSSTPPKKR